MTRLCIINIVNIIISIIIQMRYDVFIIRIIIIIK